MPLPVARQEGKVTDPSHGGSCKQDGLADETTMSRIIFRDHPPIFSLPIHNLAGTTWDCR